MDRDTDSLHTHFHTDKNDTYIN